MRQIHRATTLVILAAILALAAPSLQAQDKAKAPKAKKPKKVLAPVTAEAAARIEAAAPTRPVVKVNKKRRMLVFNRCTGFVHKSIPTVAKAMELIGKQSGVYEVVITDDQTVFTPKYLKQFDAVCFNNTSGEPLDEGPQRDALLAYVKNGGGLVGVHAATDCFKKWAPWGELMGGYFWGHPWRSGDTVTVKLDEPDHPINAAFKGKGFDITEEIYQISDPYSREKLRVLLSLDTSEGSKTDMKASGIKRTDDDFAISWIREYGKGRVFFCSIGHNNPLFENPAILEHYLAGIQYAMGDLKCDDTPSAKAGKN